MKVALLLCTYNRPQYLKQCLWSLERADLSRINQVLIADDCSTDNDTLKLISDFKSKYEFPFINGTQSNRNQGIKSQLLMSYEFLFSTHDIVINLDSDAIVRPDFVERLLDIYNTEIGIVTGFNCNTLNSNGSERHTIISKKNGYTIRKSVGGINLCTDKIMYETFIKPSLSESGNWDANTFIKAGFALAVTPSIIQHIGFESSMNHIEQPDIADDFYYWNLPTVTLLGVDSNKDRLDKAKEKCTKWIKFGSVVTVNPEINSKEQYSQFIIKEAYKLINTEHVLIFQHDGFVNNWQAWDNDWLQYDYIGAPWAYNDGMAVGNGGFSLRSRRLMEIVATDPFIQFLHPEDHHICRTYRNYLETKYGIKFAPIEVAEKFSFEGYRQPEKFLKDQFGVHGTNPRISPAKGNAKLKYVVNQYQGAGDILFLVPMIRGLIQEGNDVKWPIVSHYMNLAKHFPDLDMVCKEEVNVPYEIASKVNTEYGILLPYRFSSELMRRGLNQCMQSKYEIFGHDWQMWRQLYYTRFYDKEKQLAKLVGATGDYILVNRYFGEPSRNLKIEPIINSDLKVIEMTTIEGYSLIDWLTVIENAKEIHTANTAIMYLLELKQLNMPVYVYKRKTWGEKDFEHTRDLWTNKAFIFEQ